MEVSDFRGNLDSRAFNNWLFAMDDYFDWSDVSTQPMIGRYELQKLKMDGHANGDNATPGHMSPP